MDKSLIEQINYYYNKNEDQKFLQFKSENKGNILAAQYELYSKKCEDIINSLEAKNIESSLSKLESTILEMTNKLNDTTNIMRDLQFSGDSLNKEESNNNNEIASTYTKEAENIVQIITENLEKIKKSNYNSEYEMLENAKKINNSKNDELKLQELKKKLVESLEILKKVIKEKNSQIICVENKKNSLNENKQKIEKLLKDYNTNSDKLCAEMAENEKHQMEIDSIIKEINEYKSNDNNNSEENEKAIKEEQNKLAKVVEDNETALKEIIEKRDKAEEELEVKRYEIFGLLLLNYYLMKKINKINDVNNYNYCLKQKIAELKDLGNKLGIKSAKVQDETNKVDKRFIKYQFLVQRMENEFGFDLGN